MKIKLLSFFAALIFALPAFAQSSTETATVNVGQQITLSVTADGTAPFTYAWAKDGVSIPSFTDANVTRTNIQLSDAGVYTVTVKNSAGQASASLSLTVIVPAPKVIPPSNVKFNPVVK